MAILNFVVGAGPCLHVGLSSDTKPASTNGSTFLESDTSKLFLRSGGTWVEQTNTSYATGGGTATGTNTGDQTSIVGITGTMAQFNTAVTDGNILFNDEQGLGFRFENRTSDPGSPTVGQVWLRTDL